MCRGWEEPMQHGRKTPRPRPKSSELSRIVLFVYTKFGVRIERSIREPHSVELARLDEFEPVAIRVLDERNL